MKARSYPSLIKYMGSKSGIMDFVLEGISKVHRGGKVCDLFSGSASLSGAIGDQYPIVSNDIQRYSSVLSYIYLMAYYDESIPQLEKIYNQAKKIVDKNQKLEKIKSYELLQDIESFNRYEEFQQSFIYEVFLNDWHLFAKNYSGTWWSYEQCLWIDALREVASLYEGTTTYYIILASLMFGMAYTSQGTGHYAQYRDAKNIKAMKDIMIYRRRNVFDYFSRKYTEIIKWLPKTPSKFSHEVSALDYKSCLKNINEGTVYADPPYCFVHYSRFYHLLETLVLYDYPEIQERGGDYVKGRYREERHQSPFCLKTQVITAFEELFRGVKRSNSSLALSYSNTGMIAIEDILELADKELGYSKLDILYKDHKHMTMGRLNDRSRDVKECIILASP